MAILDELTEQEVSKNKAIRGNIVRALAKGSQNALLVRQITNALVADGLIYKDAEIESEAFAPEAIPDAEPLEEAPIPQPMPEEPFSQQQPAPEFYGQPDPPTTAAPEIAPIPPMQHRGGAYPYNRPIHLPSESHSEEDSQDNSEA